MSGKLPKFSSDFFPPDLIGNQAAGLDKAGRLLRSVFRLWQQERDLLPQAGKGFVWCRIVCGSKEALWLPKKMRTGEGHRKKRMCRSCDCPPGRADHQWSQDQLQPSADLNPRLQAMCDSPA